MILGYPARYFTCISSKWRSELGIRSTSILWLRKCKGGFLLLPKGKPNWSYTWYSIFIIGGRRSQNVKVKSTQYFRRMRKVKYWKEKSKLCYLGATQEKRVVLWRISNRNLLHLIKLRKTSSLRQIRRRSYFNVCFLLNPIKYTYIRFENVNVILAIEEIYCSFHIGSVFS